MTWFVASCAPRQEMRAVARLAEHGIEAYVPVERHLRSHARVKDTVDRPIFPRYLFAKLPEDADLAWFCWKVRGTEGVESILTVCGSRMGRPQPIPFEWVHEMRERQRAGHFDHTKGKGLDLNANDPVLIIGGPFAGQLATIMEAKPGAKRVRVFLKALGRLTGGPMQIAATDVQKQNVAA
jgi:transcriptional antiterminator RfaH